MPWEIEVSDEFKEWYESLTDQECGSIHDAVEALAAVGPALGRPQVDTLKGSRFPNMKELRVQHQGRPYRILFAFDPRRCAYMILGGDKTGDAQWYADAIRRAEQIYARHLEEIGVQNDGA
jgi:hypothetical protein